MLYLLLPRSLFKVAHSYTCVVKYKPILELVSRGGLRFHHGWGGGENFRNLQVCFFARHNVSWDIYPLDLPLVSTLYDMTV